MKVIFTGLNTVGTQPTLTSTPKNPRSEIFRKSNHVETERLCGRLNNSDQAGNKMTMSEKRNWKSTVLLASISTLGLLLVCFGLIATVRLPFLTSEGLLSWLVLLVLTLA